MQGVNLFIVTSIFNSVGCRTKFKKTPFDAAIDIVQNFAIPIC